MNIFILIFKGILLGMALVIPGVSAGTLALITGLYIRLIQLLSSFKMTLFKNRNELLNVWKDFCSLTPVFLGCILGLFLAIRWVILAIQFYPSQMYSLFSGVILGSVPFLLIQTKLNRTNLLFFGVSTILTFGLSLTSLNTFSGYLWTIFSFYIAVGTMLLPGVSGSYILMIMGTYQKVLLDINSFLWWKLGLYLLIGILSLLSFSKFIHFLLKNYFSETMACLTGMTLGGGIGIFLFTEQVLENFSSSLVFLSLSLISIIAIQFLWITFKK